MKVSSEQQEARFDLARVTAEITLKLGMAMDHDMNLSECYLLSRAEVQSLRETQAVLVKALEHAKVSHLQVSDCWYSCPLSEEGCCNEKLRHVCNCGADSHNAAIDAALARAEASKGEAA